MLLLLLFLFQVGIVIQYHQAKLLLLFLFQVGVCTVDPALLELVKKLKFKSSAVGEAIVMKVGFYIPVFLYSDLDVYFHDHQKSLKQVDLEKQIVIEDETLEDVTIDELRDSLCEHEPRFQNSLTLTI